MTNNTTNNSNNTEKQKKPLNAYARYSGIAIQMLVIIVIGSFAGVKLDELYPNNYSMFTIILSLASVIIAMYIVIKRIISASKDN